MGRWLSLEPNVDYGGFDENAGLLAYNVYAYCANNPVIYYDPTGEGLTLAFAGTGTGSYVAGAAAAGGANFWNPLCWILLGTAVVCVGIWAGVTIYNNQKAKASTKTKTLSVVKVKLPDTRVYYLAYVSDKGDLIKTGKAMNFVEALAALGISGAVNSLSKKMQI